MSDTRPTTPPRRVFNQRQRKLRAEAQRRYRQRYPERASAASAKWAKANRKKATEINRAWLKTALGRRYRARNNRRLPVTAPSSLLRSVRLLGALRKEIHEHQ